MNTTRTRHTYDLEISSLRSAIPSAIHVGKGPRLDLVNVALVNFQRCSEPAGQGTHGTARRYSPVPRSPLRCGALFQ